MTTRQKIGLLELEKSKISTKHVLHFILTILTGFWGIIWIIAGLTSNSQRNKIDKKINEVKLNEWMYDDTNNIKVY